MFESISDFMEAVRDDEPEWRWSADELEAWEYEEETLSLQIERADGSCTCQQCGFTYHNHPFSGHTDGTQYRYFLRLLCDGALVKL